MDSDCSADKKYLSHGLDGFLTTKEAAEIIGVDKRHISRLVKKGDLLGKKIGRDYFVDEEDAKRYANNRPKRGPKPGTTHPKKKNPAQPA